MWFDVMSRIITLYFIGCSVALLMIVFRVLYIFIFAPTTHQRYVRTELGCPADRQHEQSVAHTLHWFACVGEDNVDNGRNPEGIL